MRLQVQEILKSGTYGTRGITQIGREEEPALIHWVAVRVEPDHQRCSHDSRDDAEKHNKTSVVPFVAEPAHGQYDNGTDDTTRYVKDKLLTTLEMSRIWVSGHVLIAGKYSQMSSVRYSRRCQCRHSGLMSVSR